MFRSWAAAAVLLVAATVPAADPISVTATPVFHGELKLRPAAGSVDRRSGVAVVTVPGWELDLASNSNGIYPTEEPIVIAIGDDAFRLEAGAVRQRGKRGYFYRARPRPQRGIDRLTIKPGKKPRTYMVQFTVRGVQLFGLEENAPLCLPTAFIVGDDDGFSGVNYDSPGAPPIMSKRLLVANGRCSPQAWPWA